MKKDFILNEDMKEADAEERGVSNLLKKEGTAESELRPAGIARIEGRRRDVVTRGDMIPEGTSVSVVEIDGNRLVVEKAK